MSKSVILSTGRVTAADDIVTITYTEPDGGPPVVFVRWPRDATPCDPARLPAVANRVMEILAAAIAQLAVMRADEL